MDVNNVMTQLSLVEIEADYDPSLVVEDYNPDCFVLVYAVDDRESFGENYNNPCLHLASISQMTIRVWVVLRQTPILYLHELVYKNAAY